MSSNIEGHVGDTLNDLQSNIHRKRYALDVLNAEYKKICSKSESNLKCVEELASKMYNLNCSLKSIECRLEGYDRKEKAWVAEANHLQISVEELKESLEKEEKQAVADDVEFDKNVLLLVEEIRTAREFYDSTATGDEIENLHDIINCIKQEMSDINQALVELKQKHPFIPSAEESYILKNIDLREHIRPTIEALVNSKAVKQKKIDKLTNAMSLMENEIRNLSNH